jgi:NAD-dependent SIR2 family protein deacetylase
MGETKTILCGRCHVAVEERTNPDGQVLAVCPTCGESDTVENAVGEAGDYFADKVAREALAGFENIPSSPFMKVTVTHSTERSYRFILAD